MGSAIVVHISKWVASALSAVALIAVTHWITKYTIPNFIYVASDVNSGDEVIVSTFPVDYNVCLLASYDECGFLCSVGEGNLMVTAEDVGGEIWRLHVYPSIDNIFDIEFSDEVRQRKYLKIGGKSMCVKKPAHEAFRLRVVDVRIEAAQNYALLSVE